MKRRGFLGILGGALLDPDRLLWKPGKFISIPKPKRALIYPFHSANGLFNPGIRLITQYQEGIMVSRIDMLYGFKLMSEIESVVG